MKNLLFYLVFSVLLSAFSIVNAQDKITNITAPHEVSPGQTAKVTVEYSISKSRDILVNVQENGGEWKSYAWVRAKAKSGNGKLDLEVPVGSDIPLAIGAYKIGVTLVPVGGSYPERLDERTIADVDAVSASVKAREITVAVDDIISIVAPDQVSPGEKIKVTVEYGATESRDILINLTLNKEPWTNYGSTKIKAAAGTGKKEVELTVSKDIPLAANAYNLAVAIVPVGENWRSKLDSIIKGQLHAVAPTSDKKSRKKRR
ncbi:hypothetical protein J1N10_17940 [Carboxylicivirga sp. A043]|uniref:hypothetical protein n=1 Tax=Carboxylicivirga litoralis TaxID=2816963 RepID=UPI0021CAF7B5|nr:hypothetical protein [Carboxylicivirga sp. A043]MCU4157860.1 hypothetical protein [Carboxylicivirga sp. A043]